MVSDRNGARQQSYRLVVGEDSARVAAGEGNAWDTGMMASDCISTRYDGAPLKPRTRYYWQVAVTDETGQKALSEVAYFETGKMGMDGWQGNWISDWNNIHHHAAPYFRKNFSVDKPVRSARIYVAVGGLYQLHLNGKRLGDTMLNPVYTRFDRRNMYVTYDVTDAIQQQENVVGIVLPIVCVAIYLVLGFTLPGDWGWKLGWMLLFIVPLYTSIQKAIKKRNFFYFSYLTFIIALYMFMGMCLHMWHPWWIMFLTIPVYYSIAKIVPHKEE
jgi:hypothetical protein